MFNRNSCEKQEEGGEVFYQHTLCVADTSKLDMSDVQAPPTTGITKDRLTTPAFYTTKKYSSPSCEATAGRAR